MINCSVFNNELRETNNPENAHDKFTGAVYLYQLKPDVTINSKNIAKFFTKNSPKDPTHLRNSHEKEPLPRKYSRSESPVLEYE